jgi:precorrin-4 methylase
MKPLPQKFVSELDNQLKYSQEEPKIILYNVTWEQYETLATTFMDCFPALRMTYL